MKAYVCGRCHHFEEGVCAKFDKAADAVKACSFAGTRTTFNRPFSARGAKQSRRFYERDNKKESGL